MLDLDRPRVPRFASIYAICRIVGITPRVIRTDRTRRGWHVLIWIRESLTPAETIALQILFGSDNRREALNLMRAIAIRQHDPGPFWRDRWNLLYESKLPCQISKSPSVANRARMNSRMPQSIRVNGGVRALSKNAHARNTVYDVRTAINRHHTN